MKTIVGAGIAPSLASRLVAPSTLHELLTGGASQTPIRFLAEEIRRETVMVAMRDGTRLATDLYLPPKIPAPAILRRTPYGRASQKHLDTFMAFAQRGYAVISQDCRGTGESEPDSWDYYIYEPDDGIDLVEWVIGQHWCNGFVGGTGSSYTAQTQWCMAMHPRMSTIVPEVSGLGIAANSAHLYMFLNVHSRSIGKGNGQIATPYEELESRMLPETLAGGFFNEPLHLPFNDTLFALYPPLRTLPASHAKRWLWEHYCALPCAQRAELIKQALDVERISTTEIELLPAVFGHQIGHDAHTLPHAHPAQLCGLLQAPALMITGWYDWALNDTLATWDLLIRAGRASVQSQSRLIITPSAHNTPGYKEGSEDHPELQHNHRAANHVDLLLHWYAAVHANRVDAWPKVIYYLMGANEWHSASAWPPPEAQTLILHLAAGGLLTTTPCENASPPDHYTYDPIDPPPTVGGGIVSYVYPPGSADVSALQERADVLTYTTPLLREDLDVVGPIRLVLHVSSTACDTDFNARLSDVFPDGRAIQLQSALLRTRYRHPQGEPELMEPGNVYRLEIDVCATANRFKAGHRLRLDLSSADFPKFDRNTNRGGEPGAPVPAIQTIYHDPQYRSHLELTVVGSHDFSQA